MTSTEWVALAEDLQVTMRVIAAPAAGVFTVEPETAAPVGALITPGVAVGTIQRSAGPLDVVSPHSGVLVGLLVHPGERVRQGQPVAWTQPEA
jgi:biotin carboxyl carrier protein